MFSVKLIASLAMMVSAVAAQGDPEALVPQNAGKPTKSWTQWTPKPTYALEDLPDQYMGGSNRVPNQTETQSGWNRCARNKWNQQSKCQTAWLNSLEDWCIWGPPDGGDIGSTERVAVAYCTTNKHGTRLIPDGTIKGAHFLQTANYVQISGVGDFTTIGIPDGDAGGEMDPHGADDLSNPIGGVLFTTANPASNGESWFVSEWTNFMSYNQFCMRACWGNNAAKHCEHIYDVMGCRWNMPSERGYTADVFESCEGEVAPFQGIYGDSTFRQGEAVTPEAHPPAPSSNCQPISTISHGLLIATSSSSSTPSSFATSTATATSSGGQGGGATTTPGSAATSQGATSGAGSLSIAPLSAIAAIVLGAFLL
ncbi:hypothetical protein FA10DRAFT_268718 [Acaromyces ingoldii]|uniref:Macrofage activating glyco protein n=1 Tax=Acaromyces ingoldii TaxID=215250 RepID=A0A316YLD1_9BASI|nr:hypothetical protein FA10DRAFT_268718 [Acaromyces ingoldii]PWN88535.1 hypothetical protein FA10DRAFT_268718 [Acaromyces ingoldii]